MKKRKPGVAIPEAQRHTAQVKLRLPPEVAAELRRRAVGHPRGASGVVAELLTPLTWYARMASLHDIRGMMPPKIWDAALADLMAEADALPTE